VLHDLFRENLEHQIAALLAAGVISGVDQFDARKIPMVAFVSQKSLT
jgi:hypothetical protein